MNSAAIHFWQFCDAARCTPTSPDVNLAIIHKKFHKHPQRHELRAAWVVERAQRVAHITLDLDAVIAASKREEEDLRLSHKRKIATIKF